MISPRFGHTATLLADGAVLVTGGTHTGDDQSVGGVELYNPATGEFFGVGNIGPDFYDLTATLLLDGTVLIAGVDGTTTVAQIYDHDLGTFTPTGNPIISGGAKTANLLHNGQILITHGTPSAEVYEPVASPFGTTVRFEPVAVRVCGSFIAKFYGDNLSRLTYFDVRYRLPGGETDYVVFDWQQGASRSHTVGLATPTGTWIVNGVRPHSPGDHTGPFTVVSARISVIP